MVGRQERTFLPPRVSPPAGANGEELSLVPRGRNWVMGEQLAQVDNRDPFAVPVWRSPGYRTPQPGVMVFQLVRLICRVRLFSLPPSRAGPRRLRGQGREPAPGVRRPAVPHPRRRPWSAAAGTGPRRYPRRSDPGSADQRGGGPNGAAGGPVRGRVTLAAAAGLDACAD